MKSFNRYFLIFALLVFGINLTPVFAGGPLLIFDPVTRTPFFYIPASSGGSVPVYTDLGNMGPLTNAEADALTAFGFAEWSAVPTSFFNAGVVGDFSAAGLPDIIGANAGQVVGTLNGGGIHVMYDDDGSIVSNFFGAPPGVLGIASPDFSNTGSPELIESWAVLNGAAVDPADVGGASFAGVFTHEFGHAINLAHTQTNGAALFFGDNGAPTNCIPLGAPTAADQETMYPFLDPSAGSVGIDQSTIDALDDIAAISNVYPAGGWPSVAGTITGTITLWDGVTELTGVNVIARNVADPFGDAISALSGDFTQGLLGPDGLYTFNGLTPGAEYVVYVDRIVAGGFSTPPISPLPGPEEYWNGVSESSDIFGDDPCESTSIFPVAGSPFTADIVFNGDETIVLLGDDDFEERELPFNFPFCGTDYSSVFVGSNGFLTFGGGNTDFSESVADLLNSPARIAPMWDDLNPSAGGVVRAEEVGGDYVISYTDVPEFPAAGANSFTVTLHADGSFDVDYGDVTATDGLVGTSPGLGAFTGNPGEIDVTAAPQPIGGEPGDAVYEIFTDDDNDLSGGSFAWTLCADFEPVLAEAVYGICYGSTGIREGGLLLTIDPTTAAGAPIGATGSARVPGLAINSAGEIFGSTGGGSSQLIRIDGATGAALPIGPMGLAFADAIAFDNNDVLYSMDANNNLYTIDTATGASTLVGNTGVPAAPFLVGLAFDPVTDRLYASTGGLGGFDAILELDPTTGAASFVGNTGLGNGAIPDLHFDAYGNLFGAKRISGGSHLIAIDKATGVGTDIGYTGFDAVSGLATRPAPEGLWPPNHTYNRFTIPEGAIITSVTSDEPDDANGNGDGKTVDDIVFVDCNTVDLRAERAGTGNGRVYTVNVMLSNGTTGSFPVGVPHSNGGWAIADAPVNTAVNACAPASPRIAEDRLDNLLQTQASFEYDLKQNYPEPFNPATTIEFSLADQRPVTLSVYDVMGRRVAMLVDRTLDAGEHSVRWQPDGISTGMYFYRMVAGDFQAVKQMMLVK